jgi:uncharacterized protein (TIGR03437 family)
MLSAAPKLRLVTSTFGPYSIAAKTDGAPQSIEAYNAGDGSLALATASSASWLTASVGAQAQCKSIIRPACLPIQLGFKTSALEAGTYTGVVTVSDPNAVDAPQTITVTVKVGGGIPGKLDMYVAPNGSSARATMSSTTILYPFKSGEWLAVAASGAGSYSFGVTYTVTATHQPGMAEGNYTGAIGFSGSSFAPDNRNVQVVMHVTRQPIADAPEQLSFRIPQGAARQTQKLYVNNRGMGDLTVSGVTATAKSGGTWLSAGAPGAAVEIAADPAGLSPGVYEGSLAVATNAVNGPLNVSVRFEVIPASPPVATYRGAINIGSWNANDPVAPGDIVAVFGEQLSDQTRSAEKVPLGTELGPTKVLVNDQAAPLYYASYGQVNIQIPFDTPAGEATIRVVRDNKPGNAVSIQVAPRAPHILPLGEYGIIQNYSQDATFPMPPTPGLPSRRAHPGDALVMWVTGLGQSDPPVKTGDGAPTAEPLARIPIPVKVYFGERTFGSGAPADPFYVAMTAGLVGLYQVNVFIPPDAPKGDRVPLYLDIGARISNTVLIAIE